ncbi:flagellar hook-associated protein FlgL [Oceanisphaera arctica]|uniref:Flagellar hook-associated protein 3 n=1 Tax=Oceanisphaera arctica TaxID=641510 RepID=A0A2P5TMR2_9GAMM|nr:flagellar hook-associated protein FlgL [Oceanisphaera arctica]PPL16758.1 flagellar hook-associated protein 3 [Oceanisphaera arctica]GHA06043.1 flagellar hook-associated protein FlgL [Oceanisphaera arctica]
MRISTLTIFEQNISSMNRQQGEFLKVGQQIASGRRVVNPSDDPQAASRAVGVKQSMAVTEQYTNARITVRNMLAQEESVLNSLGDGITRAKTLMIQAANGTSVSGSNVSEVRGIYESILGQANASDGNGGFLFGGYQSDSPPFVKNVDGAVNYVGDDQVREQRIDASRLMPVGDNGNTIFRSVTAGAGYVAEAGAANAGNVIFTGPAVVDATDPDYGVSFTLTFEVSDDSVSYRINDGDPQVYEAGQAIRFGCLSLTLEGSPVTGDRINLGLAKNMDADLFTTLEQAIAALEAPGGTEQQRAALSNTLSTVMRKLDNSLDTVLTARASVGARLNELDVIDTVAGNRMLNYEQTLSDLVDLDYVEAVSNYSLRKVGLQAAQKSFVDIQGMSLFNFLK